MTPQYKYKIGPTGTKLNDMRFMDPLLGLAAVLCIAYNNAQEFKVPYVIYQIGVEPCPWIMIKVS